MYLFLPLPPCWATALLLLPLLLFFFVSADFVLGVLVLEGLGVIVCSSSTSSYARFSARRIVHWYDAHIMGISNRRVRMSRKAYTHKDDNITRGLSSSDKWEGLLYTFSHNLWGDRLKPFFCWLGGHYHTIWSHFFQATLFKTWINSRFFRPGTTNTLWMRTQIKLNWMSNSDNSCSPKEKRITIFLIFALLSHLDATHRHNDTTYNQQQQPQQNKTHK